jgi:transcriptional regulator with XRE-family HTH domain
LGNRIREIRKEQRYSQEELASRAGLDRSYMGHIERGEKNITILKLLMIASALSTKPSDLIDILDN